MSSLMTEIWRCTQIAEEKGQLIEIHIAPLTLNKLIDGYTSVFVNTMPMLGECGYDLYLFGHPVIVDKSIIEDNFWIRVVGDIPVENGV